MSDEPKGYFHGTKAVLAIGESVLPRAQHGGMPTNCPVANPHGPQRFPDADDYVYVTTRFIFAWAHAWCAGGVGAPLVYRVEPARPVEHDREYNDSKRAHRCPAAVVIEVYDEPAITEEQAWAGWKSADPLAGVVPFVVKRAAKGQQV